MSEFKKRSDHLQFCQDKLAGLRAKSETLKQATEAQLHDLSNDIIAAELDVQSAQAALDELGPHISVSSAPSDKDRPPASKVHSKTASDDVKVVTKK